jgi:hypothetical protein
MSDYAIRSPRAPRAGQDGQGFDERLYDTLRSAPWWLASTGVHAVGLLVLSALAGGESAAAQTRDAVSAAMAAPEVPLDPDVELPPEFLRTDPIDEKDVIVDEIFDDDNRLDDVEEKASEDDDVSSVDPRVTSSEGRGPFEGPGQNGTMGVGPGAGHDPFGRAKRRALVITGGSEVIPAADAGLIWLRNHQSPGGYWDCDGFESMCSKNKCGGPGGPLFDPGVTGLAILPFLGCGETHKSPRYGRVVRNGLKYLKGIQDAEGCFGSRTSNHFTYNHAIAALAMVEAYGMTQSPLFKSSAQNAVNFIHACRNPYQAWRYGVRPQDNDTSVTGWMVMALKSAVLSQLDVDPEAFDGARLFLDKVTEPEYGRAGYTLRGNGPARPQELMDRFPMDKSESLTAVAVLARIFCGATKDDESVRKGADLMSRLPPQWDEAAGTIDFYYWYYGTLAMYQLGGKPWERWNDAMTGSLVKHQRLDKSDCRYGSWDPIDPWAADGGRVYATAINTLSLEVYYRYDRVAGAK